MRINSAKYGSSRNTGFSTGSEDDVHNFSQQSAKAKQIGIKKIPTAFYSSGDLFFFVLCGKLYSATKYFTTLSPSS